MRTPTAKKNRIVQIEVTTMCDKTCANCTRALAQVRKPDMTPEQFRIAVGASYQWILRENGVLSLFGGNPCVSKHFEEYCAILAEFLPPRNRGLWTNNFLGKGDVVARYFNRESTFNFNVHMDTKAAEEIRSVFPWAKVWGVDRPSSHASIFIASRDFLPEEQIWENVKKCTYDIHWSAIIIQEAPDWKQLGGYSCEIAATHARTNGQALGLPVTPGWLDCTVDAVRHQYEYACPRCSGCLNVEGVQDLGEGSRDQFSVSNQHLVDLTISKTRKTEVVEQLTRSQHIPIDYLKRG